MPKHQVFSRLNNVELLLEGPVCRSVLSAYSSEIILASDEEVNRQTRRTVRMVALGTPSYQ